MTIAGVYLSPEGIVLGADSTSSVVSDNGYHFFNFGQKIFEIGEHSTFGLVTWGLAGLGRVSYRTLVARLADDLEARPPASVEEVATRWTDIFWPHFSANPNFIEARNLGAKLPFDPEAPDPSLNRSMDEEARYRRLSIEISVGFCIAGYVKPDRTPMAVSLIFSALEPPPTPQFIAQHSVQWWGMQNIMNRVIYGVEDATIEAIKASGHWTGSDQDLARVFIPNALLPKAALPMRDAVDYVHSAIYCTIKAMKFSQLPQVCGGPVELAVITTDRKFRWVRHKPWDAAVVDGDFS